MQQDNKQKIKTLYGNEFEFNTEQNLVSSLSPGYIIRPDGIIAKVNGNEDHSDVFNRYLKGYLEQNDLNVYHQNKCINLLTNDFGHVIYYGVKVSDAKDLYARQGNVDGCGFFFIPDDTSVLTDIQKEKCLDIINSNISPISKREILPLNYQSMGQDELLPIDSLLPILNGKTKKR